MSFEQFALRSSRKTPRSLSEAFLDDEWCSAITRPEKAEYGLIYGLLVALLLSSFFGWCFFSAINRI
jgi:hypothetical protein